MNKTLSAIAVAVAVLSAGAFGTTSSFGHGDVTPQPVDTTGLDNLGSDWRSENPFRGNEIAIRIGSSGYNQNCARCHGLQVQSGGIAPDLRYLEEGKEGDEWFITRIRHGYTFNGATRMPAFEGILSQEAMWAIRAYIETRPKD